MFQSYKKKHIHFIKNYTMNGNDFGNASDKRQLHSINANYLLNISKNRNKIIHQQSHKQSTNIVVPNIVPNL